ncbi:MAG TPA: Stk1 family PASTA domain-containing Ser/Thr kinase [Nocardioidaceae bacterium]
MDKTMIGHGRYQMGALLGRGGMAEVHRAEDLRLGRPVAIKRLRVDLASDPTFQARFRREAQSAASLNHPTIVAVYDTGEEEAPDGSGLSLPYIVMELVEGRTLRDILREGRRILPERALEITSSVLEALDYSHRAGIIHRDIKPANVMLTPSGDVKVMDFGIARAIADSSATMTQTAAVVGTAQYLSPEQARGEQVDARSDLYSAGCLLFELLTGRPPFVGDSPVSVAYQHVREDAVPPSAFDPELSPAIDAITLKALAKSVDQRYQSASEMRADIMRALEGRSVLAPAVAMEETQQFLPPPPTDSTPTAVTPAMATEDREEGRRRVGLWILLAALVVAALAAGLYYAFATTGDGVTTTTVPNVQGLTLDQAEKKIEDANLVVGDETPENSDTVKKGLVLRQSETPNATVDEGTVVDLTYSAGQKTAIVPDVTDMNLTDATAALEDRGFNVIPKQDTESPEAHNQVTRTDPGPSTRLPVGSNVTVFYSTGFREVPNVVGQTERNATHLLQSLGFVVVPSDIQSDQPEGQVVAQNPPGESRQPFGSTVVIQVSLGPTETTPIETTPTETTPTETTPTETTTETTPTP